MNHLFVFTLCITFVLFFSGQTADGSTPDFKIDPDKARCTIYESGISTFSKKDRKLNSSCSSEEYIPTSYILTKACNGDSNSIDVTGINIGTDNMKLKVVLPGAITILAEKSKIFAGRIDLFVNEQRVLPPYYGLINDHKFDIDEMRSGEAIVVTTEYQDWIYFYPAEKTIIIIPNKPPTSKVCGLCV